MIAEKIAQAVPRPGVIRITNDGLTIGDFGFVIAMDIKDATEHPPSKSSHFVEDGHIYALIYMDFFTKRNGIYAAFLDKEGPGYVTFRGQGGEEIVIGVAQAGAATRVSGSTYLFDQQIARFFSGLPTVASMATAAPVELPVEAAS